MLINKFKPVIKNLLPTSAFDMNRNVYDAIVKAIR